MGFIPSWAIGGAVIIFASALAKLFLAKMRAAVPTPPPSDEVHELRQAIDAMQNRVGELEERVDFTERLLAKQREADRLAPPST